MPTSTYDLIASNVLSSSASSVTFSSIPATYRDLVLVYSGTNATGEQSLGVTFNGDTGTNYAWVRMQGNGSTATSGAFVDRTRVQSETSDLTVTNHIFQIMDYSATDKHKTTLVRGNNAAAVVTAYAARWLNTAAINSVTIAGNNNYNFNSGSAFHLFGIVS